MADAVTARAAPASNAIAKVRAPRNDKEALARVIRRLEPKIRKRIAELLEWVATRRSTAEIELAFSGKVPSAALDEAALKRAARGVAAEAGVIFAAAARAAGELVAAAVRVPATVDVGTARALAKVDAIRSRLARDLITEQRQVLQEVLTIGLREGLNPRQTARVFRDVVTLAPNQVKYVASYRRALEGRDWGNALGRALRDRRYDRKIERAARAGKGLTKDEIDGMVARYRERARNLRAETIARTETLRAVHLGAEEGWQQAIDAGDIDAAKLERTWIQTYDKRTRDSHRAMRGQTRPFGVPFTSGEGYSLMFPHDPSAPLSETVNCRCAVVTRIVPSKDTSDGLAAAEQREREKKPRKPRAPRKPKAPAAPPVTPAAAPPTPPVAVSQPAAPALDPNLAADLDWKERHLRDGVVVERRELGGGVNATELVELEAPGRGRIDGVWKPSTGEAAGVRGNIADGTQWRREVAAYKVAARLGVADLVPVTIQKTIDDVVGSLQELSIYGRHTPAAPVEIGAAQRARAFDIITGNSDRHNGNILYTGSSSSKPVLIDNGLTFPKGAPSRFVQPESLAVTGKLTDEVKAIIAGIDERELAADLLDAGIEPIAVKETLYRARLAKLQPEWLELPDTLVTQTEKFLALRRMGVQFMEAGYEISAAARNQIEAMVDDMAKQRGIEP